MNIMNINQEGTNPFSQQAQLLKLLAHPARLQILEILRNGEECVCHMEALLGYRQAYLSQQLAVLREAGFLEDRREGWNIYYRVVRPEVFSVLAAVYAMLDGPKQQPVFELKGTVCSCPKCEVTQHIAKGDHIE